VPFRYLGIPVKPQRLTKLDCQVFVESIMAKTKASLVKKLLYIAKNTSVNYELLSITSHKRQMFLLPNAALDWENQFHRNFM